MDEQPSVEPETRLDPDDAGVGSVRPEETAPLPLATRASAASDRRRPHPCRRMTKASAAFARTRRPASRPTTRASAASDRRTRLTFEP